MGYLILDICITAAGYAALPLIIAGCGTSQMSAKKYRLYCFLANIPFLLICFIINRKTTGAPYVFYTLIFSSVGTGMLKKRGRIPEKPADDSEKFIVKPEMRKFICTACGTVSVAWNNECPNCHAVGLIRKGTDEEIRAWNETEEPFINSDNVNEEEPGQ